MHRIRTLLLLVSLLTVVFAAQAVRIALAPGEQAPDLRGYTATGGRVVADYEANTVTLVNFWATWCEPCRQEMPALERLYRKHGSSGLQIIGVLKENIPNEAIIDFVESMEVSYPIIRPDRRVDGAWGGIGTLPTSFLIDQHGVILRRYVGATAEQTEGLAFDVAEVLEGRPLGPFIDPQVPAAVTNADRPKPPENP